MDIKKHNGIVSSSTGRTSEGQRVKSCWHPVDSFMSDVLMTSQWD